MSVEPVESREPVSGPKMIQSFEEWKAQNGDLPPAPQEDSEWAPKPKEAPLTMEEIQERRDRADGVIEMERPEQSQAEAMVSDILAKARAGEIVGSDGTVYDEEFIRHQLASLAKGLNKGPSEESFKALMKYIPRSGGLRDSVREAIETPKLGAAFTEKITKIYWELEKEKSEALRSEEKLKEIGDESLEASGVEDPSDDPKSFEAMAAEAARGSIHGRVPSLAELQSMMGGQSSPEVAEKPRKATEEILEQPIDIQRSIRDYAMYLDSADRSIKINGYNRDAQESRDRATDILNRLPTALHDLAKRYHAETKNV